MAGKDKRPVVAGVGISSGDRVVFPDSGITKLDIARYYRDVADRMLRVVKDRPLSLVRLPEGLDGERFFQKHAGKGFPDTIRRFPLREASGETAEYMSVSTASGLVGAAQMGAVEFHVWGSRRDRLERPDRMIFDLDPDEGLGFGAVRDAAVDLRGRLEALGLPSWPMVTGGKGVHVVVELRRTAEWDRVSGFARRFAALCAAEAPDRYTADIRKAERGGRVFIDWLRNERGSTAVAPFSLRARQGAPVAVPVTWDELAGLDRANGFGMKAALDRDWPEIPGAVSLTREIAGRIGA